LLMAAHAGQSVVALPKGKPNLRPGAQRLFVSSFFIITR
jgi:hypothetical protein